MKNNNGSCLLMLTLISSVILIYALNSWQTVTFNYNLVRKKYDYESNFRTLESLHNFGIFKCINNYRKIYKNKNPNNGTVLITQLYNGPWPLESDLELMKLTNLRHYDSLIILTINDDLAIINSKLINNQTKETYIMESKLKKLETIDSDTNLQTIKFSVYDWKF